MWLLISHNKIFFIIYVITKIDTISLKFEEKMFNI